MMTTGRGGRVGGREEKKIKEREGSWKFQTVCGLPHPETSIREAGGDTEMWDIKTKNPPHEGVINYSLLTRLPPPLKKTAPPAQHTHTHLLYSTSKVM